MRKRERKTRKKGIEKERRKRQAIKQTNEMTILSFPFSLFLFLSLFSLLLSFLLSWNGILFVSFSSRFFSWSLNVWNVSRPPSWSKKNWVRERKKRKKKLHTFCIWINDVCTQSKWNQTKIHFTLRIRIFPSFFLSSFSHFFPLSFLSLTLILSSWRK